VKILKNVLPIYEIFFKTFAPTPEHPSQPPMPPKADPCATRAQRRIDVLLIVITAITVAILLLTGSHGRAESALHASAPIAEKASH
jgi:hypothetical protein